jgi:Sigma-54 factor, Activator interacting domain (AID)
MAAANLSLALTPRLDLQVSPALLAFTEVLALPLAELEELVERELAANPALVRPDGPACPGCGRPLTDPNCPACDAGVSRRAGGPPGVDDDGPVVPHRPSAAELLEAEAGPLIPTRDRWLVSYLVAELDDLGLLGRDSGELAADPARLARALDASPGHAGGVAVVEGATATEDGSVLGAQGAGGLEAVAASVAAATSQLGGSAAVPATSTNTSDPAA